jgi:DNA-binding HxlR family transcriptional regulator
MKKTLRRSECPISSVLDILGDKWTFLIIRDMMFLGKKTYGEFLSSDETIATNILADRLLILERVGIIEKNEFPGSKVKILYKLTPKGIDLMPILMELVLWGDKYFIISEKGKRFADKIREDKDGLIKVLSERLST